MRASSASSSTGTSTGSLKQAQSTAGSVTGATGAIYAIRRPLFRPVRADVNDDLLTSLRVIAQGYRLVFAPDAVAYEPVGRDRTARPSRVACA